LMRAACGWTQSELEGSQGLLLIVF
jgi:hypothetical protein